jgi:hypothetical protein
MTNPDYAGIDSVLKWMLVTCFGYTGYRNAKFGQIQVHERITGISRELLMQIKELAEGMDFQVLHGIMNCLWVIGEPIGGFKEAVEKETGILTEVDSYDGIAFLPMVDGSGQKGDHESLKYSISPDLISYNFHIILGFSILETYGLLFTGFYTFQVSSILTADPSNASCLHDFCVFPNY